MGKRMWVCGFWTAIMLGLALGAGVAWAKPADLPVPSQPECLDGTDDPGSLSITLDLWTGRIADAVMALTEQPAAIDTVCPAFLPALLEQLVTQAGNALMQPRQPLTPEEKLANQRFHDGEVCERLGQLEMARLCYQQAHLLAPTSKRGRQAIDRLQKIEERLRDTSEEQTEPPVNPLDPEAVFRDIRSRTVPLGLVVVSY